MACGAIATTGFAQNRTAYFNDNTYLSNRLNPGILPTRGYISMPLLGNVQMEMSTDFKNMNDLVNAFSTDEFTFDDDAFYDRMKTDNRFDTSMKLDLVSLGWWKGENFWNVNIGLKVGFGASVPKSLFEFIRESNRNSFYGTGSVVPNVDVRNVSMKLNAYAEAGVGYSRRVNERFTVGGRAKLIFGLANFDLAVDELSWDLDLPDNPDNPSAWDEGATYGGRTTARAHLRSSIGGGGLEFDPDGVVSGFDMNSFGIGGYGVGFDLGVTYQPIERLTVSASVQDLGFIKWKKSAVTQAAADQSENVTLTADNYDRYMSDDLFDLDMYEMREVEPEGYTSGLGTSVMLGGEYRLGPSEQFSAGALYSARFGELNTTSAITFVGGFVPRSFFNASVSYSYVQRTGSVVGGLLKLGNLLLGAEYAFAGPQSSYNFFLGIGIGIGKRTER